MLEARDLARHYRVSQGWFKPKASVKALNGVSFTLQRGQTLAVVGESGCGKSTLARQLTLIEPPSSGALLLQGVDAAVADPAQLKALRQQVQMVFQNPYASLNPRASIETTLGEPLLINTRLTKAERRERIEALLALVGLRSETAGIPEGAPLVDEAGAQVGRVTSSGFGVGVGAHIALGLVRHGVERHGDLLTAASATRRRHVRVRLAEPCAYDPEGARLA